MLRSVEMKYIAFLLVPASVIALFWYFRSSNKDSPDQTETTNANALSRSRQLLSETDELLEQIQGIRTRHAAFFERYCSLLKETQRLQADTGRQGGNIGTITHRVLALKQQVEKEKNSLLK